MTESMGIWSYVAQWFGYLGWCAQATDPACRPFVGFIALFGASAGFLALLVLAMVGMMYAWERDYLAARALRQRAASEVPRAAEPALGANVPAPVPALHAEPVMAAAVALAPETDAMRGAALSLPVSPAS